MKKVGIVLLFAIAVMLAGAVNAQIAFNEASKDQIAITSLSTMPLTFTENHGQWGEKTLFKAEAGGATFYFCKDEVAYLFIWDTDKLEEDQYQNIHGLTDILDKSCQPRYKKEALLIKAQFVGANPNPEVIPEGRLPHNRNYFYGNDPSKWCTDVANYSSLTYKDIWSGIDLKYHGNGKGLKYDFIVSPGADISQIKIRYEGADNLTITPNGDLETATLFGSIHEKIPSVYQEIGGGKREVTGRYVITTPGVFGFEVDDYNPSLTLVIDPELIYSTYLGGSDNDFGYGIALDSDGNAYVTGETYSTDFPIENPYDGSHNSGGDVFVTKLSASGNSLLYSTYLGGISTDYGRGIAVDGSGCAYITGKTWSPDFPVENPYDGIISGNGDVFITKLSTSGNSLVYSTYLGGGEDDRGYDIAIGSTGSAHIAGYTSSPTFRLENPYDNNLSGDSDAFVAKLSPAGNSLDYSTYLGGANREYGSGIAVDGFGNAYVTGSTESGDFPTADSYDGSYNGNYDVFVTKFSLDGNSLDYSTYLGGTGNDNGGAIVIDGSGSAYITGTTASSDFPVQNPYDGSWNGSEDAFAARLSAFGNSLSYSTYLGGSSSDSSLGIAVDGSGSAYVTGFTMSTDFPTIDPYQTDQGDYDVFVTKFGPGLVYYYYLPGDVNMSGWAWPPAATGPDVTYLVNFFRGLPTSHSCLLSGFWCSADANGDCDVIGSDVTKLVNVFRGLTTISYCADYPPAWPPIPEEAPSGWPNCE